MLEKYKTIYPQIYTLLSNTIKSKKYSHAYLIETQNHIDGKNIAISFSKSILCSKSYLNQENCEKCNQCKQIDDNNFPELTIIKPDGMWIKKGQLEELQKEFSKKPIYSLYKIYIIEKADQLNLQAANSILKFLEEPPANTIAILITEKPSEILPTIISRCQIINVPKQKSRNTSQAEELQILLDIPNKKTEELQTVAEEVINFIINTENYPNQKINQWIKLNELTKTREELEQFFNIMTFFYKDTLNYKTTNTIEIFKDNTDEIEQISNTNTVDKLITKINLVLELKKEIKYNVNINMLIDKLILKLEEVI